MSDISTRLEKLSPEKRALLMMRLREKSEQDGKNDVITRRKNKSEYPMSFAQERMWFLHQWNSESHLYNISAALRFTGKFDVQIFEKSLNEVIKRHEVLRATFQTEDGKPKQFISKELILPVQLTDLLELPESRRQDEIMRLAREDARTPFDMVEGPLIRAKIIRVSNTEHIFLFSLHHSISDGWSVGILIKELALIYESLVQDKPVLLPELPIQYADFAVWQRERLREDLFITQIEYWKKQLADIPPALELPTDRPRPAMPTFNGAHWTFSLSKKVVDSLKAFTKESKATIFTILLSAFKILLHRYTHQTDICVGIPVAYRNRYELEDLIGLFVNTLVIRSQFSRDQSFNDLIHQVKETVLEAYAHQDLPFETLVENLNVNRNLSHSPLFQTMFVYQDAKLESFESSGVRINLLEVETGTAKFDLTLLAEEIKDQIRMAFEYNTDLFTQKTIERMASHFQLLLNNALENPGKIISKLPIMTSFEEKQLTEEWNNTKVDYPLDKCVHQFFESRAEQNPNDIAVTYKDQQLTYSELNRRVNQFAHYLKKQGVQSNTPVGLCFERSFDMIVGVFGVLKAGGAFVPLDIKLPKERLAYIIDDSHISILITQKHLANDLALSKIKVICIDSDWKYIAAESKENPANMNAVDQLAYIIYTSGTTGKPKGVMLAHRGLTNLSFALLKKFFIDRNNRILQFSSFSFDAFISEIFPSLIVGAQLHLVDQQTLLSNIDLIKTINENKITNAVMPPSLLSILPYDNLPTLSTIISAGEACTWEIVSRWSAGRRFINGYGPTESTVCTNANHIEDSDRTAMTVPIGRPIDNIQGYVLDKNLHLVPVGIFGEYHVGGIGLAWGYLNRPDLTAEKFIPNPFSNEPGTRLYKTGDLVRYLPDGKLEFWGRIDHQVKIRGFRIELGEIEEVLSQHRQVMDVAVLAREDVPGDKRLVAYIVAKQNDEIDTADLRNYLKERIPEYMIPANFMMLESFPLNSSGKIDRNALPAPDRSRSGEEKKYVSPRSKLEEYLVEIWQSILKLDKIGIYDNFFELGGNSLQAAVFVNRIQKEFNEKAHIRSIFLAPTIAEFSMYVSEYYPDLVSKRFGEDAAKISTLEKVSTVAVSGETIDESKIADFKNIVRLHSALPELRTTGSKNQRAVFVLSPPRSGSTLFRVMLAGNQKLFAPPELDLLSFQTLDQRRQSFSNNFQIWLEATWRAIMEVKSCDLREAQQIMNKFEKQSLTTKEFYRVLQDWIGEKILVDKTPSYAMDSEILNRMEVDFNEPLYIHLTRHPYATIYSFLEAKLDQNFIRFDHPFSRRELAELIWLVSHQNIIEFVEKIPTDRKYQIKFEDLVEHPEEQIRSLCGFLKIEFNNEMLKPYQGQRMTDGVSADSQMVGDFKFYLHKKIDNKAANRWKKFHREDFLSHHSWQTAEKLGYAKIEEDGRAGKIISKSGEATFSEIKPVDRSMDLPLSFQQKRLWFLHQMDPESSSYNIPAAVNITGNLNVEIAEECFNEIIKRHEILRTNYTSVDGVAKLTVVPFLKIKIRHLDLSKIPETERLMAAQNEVTKEIKKKFDLEKDPLIRSVLLRIDEKSHILILTMHHIISDGWSASLFIKEFTILYHAFSAEKKSTLAELLIQYLDYAHWQNQWLNERTMEDDINYWRQKLSGAPQLLQLPTDRPRPAEMTYNGANQRVVLSKELTEKLKLLGRQAGVTDYMILLTAFKILLYRYSGQTDINVGIPIANRNRAEIENLIGFFVNTLVLRTQLSYALNFKQALKKVEETSLEAYEHQNLPFEMLVDNLQPERNMSHSPLFQVMFAFQEDPIDIKISGLSISPIQIESTTSKFDITLSMLERDGEFRGIIEYNTDLFNGNTISHMIENFEVLLRGIVTNPDQYISRLPLVSQSEQKKLLFEWNNTRADYPSGSCLHQIFEAQAHKIPETKAVVYENAALTYQALNQRANQLANFLRGKGIGSESLVAIYMNRSLDVIIAILGILKSGAAYVIFDPAFPEQRLDFMIEDTGIRILLSQEKLFKERPLSVSQPIYLDSGWDKIARESSHNPVCNVSAKNPAYVLYTSGSTGVPKGVCCIHGSIVNLISDFERKRQLSAGDHCSLWTSLNFDVSVYDIFSALLTGATLYIVPEEVRADSIEFFEWMKKHQVHSAYIPPFMLADLVSWHNQNSNRLKLKRLLVGVEPIQEQVLMMIAGQIPSVKIINGYGPTETTVCSTLYELPEHSSWDRNAPIGKPVQNTQIYIVDQNLQITPIGVPGEIYIGGAGLARGYLNRPDLTAEKFVPDPFSHEAGSRLYKTGDVARYIHDGNIEFIGRQDFQVKIRGFRIELKEIENALSKHPDIKETVVIAHEDVQLNKRLVAYLELMNENAPDAAIIKTFLKDVLPDYMIPSAYVFMKRLPLTPSGKIDRKALPDPEFGSEKLNASHVPPQTKLEKKLVQIWSQVLGVDIKRIGVTDNFFEMGGDSILTIQVISRAKQIGVQLLPKHLFQFPTIADLAKVAKTVQIKRAYQGIISGDVPLTPIQHLFFEQHFPDQDHWNQSLLLEVREEIDLNPLIKSIEMLVNHHDALRLRFEMAESNWKEYNAAKEKNELFSFFDLSELPASGQKKVIQTTAEQVQKNLDIKNGPIIRFAFFKLSGDTFGHLLIVIHHLAIDGISWRILMEDFYTLYNQLSHQKTVEIPLKTTSFQKWAKRLEYYAQSAIIEQEIDFWNEIVNKKIAHLPIDYPKGSNLERDGENIVVSLTQDQTKLLFEDVLSVYGTEINDILLTALVKAFTAWSGGKSTRIDLEGHGREEIFDDIDLSRTVGWFTCLHPAYLELNGNLQLGESIKSIKEQLRRIPNRGIGFGILKYISKNERIGKEIRTCLHSDISFNYLGRFDQIEADLKPFKLLREIAGHERSLCAPRMHKIAISGSVIEGVLNVNWNYSKALFRFETIENLANKFIESLMEIINHCLSPGAGGYTPSDFEDVNLQQEDIEDIIAELEHI